MVLICFNMVLIGFGARRAPKHLLRMFGGHFWGPEGPKTPSTIVWVPYFGARKAPNTLFSIIRFLLYFGLGRAESAAMAGPLFRISLIRFL